ncbi:MULTISPECIES: MinD/ParA family ATP-binding protein [Cyanophyceae]|jgi:septum site-determining protein MinD|nr:MinD/ParA family protein [Cyanobium sp. Lug-B]MCP9797589.1 MinD/ParA family protein [Cyanobium sp. Lug-B]MCP9933865.1 MinD/ParA family protein [Cyanobium sp. Candia 9D4]
MDRFMTRILSVHSFRGGTGKSNLSANLAAAFAARGLRVGVFDTDLASPGIHVLFGFTAGPQSHTLNDHLQGSIPIEKCSYDVTPASLAGGKGRIILVPAAMEGDRIARLLREGYEVERLNDALFSLGQSQRLDLLIVDTHPGINEETLLSTAISDCLVMVMRPDQQDYLGTAVAIEVAQRLMVPEARLVVNKLPAHFDAEQVRARVAQSYGIPVGAILPLSDDLLTIASGSLALVDVPSHPWSTGVTQLAADLADALL